MLAKLLKDYTTLLISMNHYQNIKKYQREAHLLPITTACCGQKQHCICTRQKCERQIWCSASSEPAENRLSALIHQIIKNQFSFPIHGLKLGTGSGSQLQGEPTRIKASQPTIKLGGPEN
ncbi:Hypothetical_protein [Hexamita inflata]|uniref:Hypothetical_protein n=1 Tax=Hexamita inflata TaxID=28002 RepID=A0ABP1IK75_9EUKA